MKVIDNKNKKDPNCVQNKKYKAMFLDLIFGLKKYINTVDINNNIS